MPPYRKTTCPHCKEPVIIDMAEIEKETGSIYKRIPQEQSEAHEYRTVCPHCKQPFKFKE